MSRIGKLPIDIPEKVSVTVDKQNLVKVEGPKGKLVKQFKGPIDIVVEDTAVTVKPGDNSRLARSLHGTVRSIIGNMVEGVTNGFSKDLIISGVGFRATMMEEILDLQLGYSHEIKYPIPTGINITVVDGTKVKVEGIDKHLVGQVTADIKHYYPVEPYKGKGVRVVGEYVRRKEGKKAG